MCVYVHVYHKNSAFPSLCDSVIAFLTVVANCKGFVRCL